MFLALQLLLVTFRLSSFAYPTYQASSDLVIVAPYETSSSGAANWGHTSAGYREFITIGQRFRIRQTGTISRIRMYTVNKTNLTGFYVKIWRKDGSTNYYDLVGTSDNIVDSLVAGDYASIDLVTPISVEEGDYYGYRIEKSGDTNNFFARATPALTNAVTYFIDDVTPSATNYGWESVPPNSSASNTALPIELYMTAPQVVFIGDSIIAGHPGHYSGLETAAITNIDSTMEKQFEYLTGYIYQNMGMGGQRTSYISSRFNKDTIDLKPKIVVIEGGVNDIASGVVTESTFIANWTNMLDAAQADSNTTTIIVLKILPWTEGTTTQMQTRDDWNASLVTLAAGYSKAIVVDTSSYVGQFRPGGDVDNLWDIQPAYNLQDVHFNQAGHMQIAQAIADNLPKASGTFDNDFSTWNSGDITTNYNLIQTGGNANTNISQTASSGIEYSTDGSTWYDATDGGGASEGLTGLSSSASPGDNHVFVWDSSTDLAGAEDSTVYLRIRPNDGTADADDWVNSDAFGIDYVAPSSVGVPTFGTITTSSIEVVKPTVVTEDSSGLYQWQIRRDSTTELGLNAIATTSVTDSSLSENTQYTYDVQFEDNQNNTSSYGTSTTKYTLADTPTNISPTAQSATQIDISVDTFPNDSVGSSGYYFENTTAGLNSGWIQTNSWENTGLSGGTSYTYSVKYRNADGTETESISTTKYTLVDTPTNISSTAQSKTQINISVDTFPNDSVGSSGYYFENTTAGSNSGWIQTNSWENTGLSCENSYTYSVKYRNVDGTETDSISTTGYTLVDTPTNISSTDQFKTQINLSVDTFLNDSVGSSGYYFENTTAGLNSGWIQTNLWQDSELSCGTSYTYSVKYRNGDGTETDSISTTASTSACGGSGLLATSFNSSGGGGGGGGGSSDTDATADEDGEEAEVESDDAGTVGGGTIGGTASASGGGGFTDTSGHWAEGFIEDLYVKGVVSGYDAEHFGPENNISRAELTKIAIEAFEIALSDDEGGEFSDVPVSEWYAPYVKTAYLKNIAGGYGDGTFGPNKNISRAEALRILFDAAGIDVETDYDAGFSDVSADAWWYASYVNHAAENGIVNGYSDGTFGPNDNLTRAQVSKIVSLMIDMYVDSSGGLVEYILERAT